MLHIKWKIYKPYLGNSRLIGGDKENWGLLQVAHTGQWGSVCGRRKGVDFSDKAANVACRNMGFEVGYWACKIIWRGLSPY